MSRKLPATVDEAVEYIKRRWGGDKESSLSDILANFRRDTVVARSFIVSADSADVYHSEDMRYALERASYDLVLAIEELEEEVAEWEVYARAVELLGGREKVREIELKEG